MRKRLLFKPNIKYFEMQKAYAVKNDLPFYLDTLVLTLFSLFHERNSLKVIYPSLILKYFFLKLLVIRDFAYIYIKGKFQLFPLFISKW